MALLITLSSVIHRRRPPSLSAPRVATASALAGIGLIAALVALSSCADGNAAPEVTVVAAATSTTFRTEPVRTTTTTIAPPPTVDDGGDGDGGGVGDGGVGDGGDADPDGSAAPTGEQTYEVRAGDYLVRIARQFDVTAEAIVAYNGWESLQHDLQPGAEILIPPQDWDPDESIGSGAPDEATESSDGAAADGSCPDGSEQETYTIQAGDVKGTVARRFDVTVAELDAANATTPYYAGFVIGIDIVIPC